MLLTHFQRRKIYQWFGVAVLISTTQPCLIEAEIRLYALLMCANF